MSIAARVVLFPRRGNRMKRAVLAISALVPIFAFTASAQTRPDFSGTWRMDPSRSESAMQGEPVGAITVVITQTGNEIRIETTTPRTRSAEVYRLDGSESTITGGVATARWFGDALFVDAVRDVSGVSVTTKQMRQLTPDGNEMQVDNVVEVQHGYTLARAQTYGAGKDMFIRVR